MYTRTCTPAYTHTALLLAGHLALLPATPSPCATAVCGLHASNPATLPLRGAAGSEHAGEASSTAGLLTLCDLAWQEGQGHTSYHVWGRVSLGSGSSAGTWQWLGEAFTTRFHCAAELRGRGGQVELVRHPGGSSLLQQAQGAGSSSSSTAHEGMAGIEVQLAVQPVGPAGLVLACVEECSSTVVRVGWAG